MIKLRKYIICVLTAVFLSFSLLPALVTGSTIDQVKDRKEDVDSQKNAAIAKKAQEIKLRKQLENEEARLAGEQELINSEYNKLVDEIEDLNTEIIKLDTAIAEAEEDYQHHIGLFKKRLYVMYMNSRNSFIDMFLKSKDISEFFEKVQFVSSVSKIDRQLIAEVKTCKVEIAYKKMMRTQMKIVQESSAGEKKVRMSELQASRSELNNKIGETRKSISDLEREVDKLEKLSRELNDEIKRLQRISKYIGGDMAWPVPGRTNVVSLFGMRMHPILKKYKMHTGIDIDAWSGEKIVAANDGIVVISGWRSGYGNTVVIDHGGGISTLYAHCSKLLVSVGQSVKKSQVIAKIGMTGLATGDHLHFEIRVNGAPVDPLKFGK